MTDESHAPTDRRGESHMKRQAHCIECGGNVDIPLTFCERCAPQYEMEPGK